MITDFFDQMKSRSKGYASMEYSVSGYRPNDLVRLDVLIAGEPGNAIVPEVAPRAGEFVLHKPGKGAFCGTSLHAELRARGVTHVYVCGLAFELCVAFTAIAAAEHGFVTHVVEDACRCASISEARQREDELKRAGVRIVSASEVQAITTKHTNATLLDDAILAVSDTTAAKEAAWKVAGLPAHGIRSCTAAACTPGRPSSHHCRPVCPAARITRRASGVNDALTSAGYCVRMCVEVVDCGNKYDVVEEALSLSCSAVGC